MENIFKELGFFLEIEVGEIRIISWSRTRRDGLGGVGNYSVLKKRIGSEEKIGSWKKERNYEIVKEGIGLGFIDSLELSCIGYWNKYCIKLQTGHKRKANRFEKRPNWKITNS